MFVFNNMFVSKTWLHLFGIISRTAMECCHNGIPCLPFLKKENCSRCFIDLYGWKDQTPIYGYISNNRVGAIQRLVLKRCLSFITFFIYHFIIFLIPIIFCFIFFPQNTFLICSVFPISQLTLFPLIDLSVTPLMSASLEFLICSQCVQKCSPWLILTIFDKKYIW